VTSLLIRGVVIITMNDRFDSDFTPLHVDRRALAAEARDAARQLAARAPRSGRQCIILLAVSRAEC